ncbi:hypothetical protein E2C01_031225 [Portunus trituberculatus]|uniref:Uncharacterized protein n=1 Tax=Portunus trituberculatus TaxID=210409 RepID=A0A5B7EWA9_PORTR|nr:hypothetical protein [Portunus trituberculatus]
MLSPLSVLSWSIPPRRPSRIPQGIIKCQRPLLPTAGQLHAHVVTVLCLNGGHVVTNGEKGGYRKTGTVVGGWEEVGEQPSEVEKRVVAGGRMEAGGIIDNTLSSPTHTQAVKEARKPSIRATTTSQLSTQPPSPHPATRLAHKRN